MSDEHTPIMSKLDIICAELADQKTRLNELRGIQIENCGRDGRNGKLLAVRNAVDDIQKTLKTNQDAIQKLMQEQGSLATRVGLYAALGAGALAAAVPRLLHLIGG